MNSFIETLNQWGGNFPGFAWPMFWQSSLLIVALFACEFLLRRRLRASIRYTLWLVVLVKLCVPPTFALPTSPVWWLHQTPSLVAAKPKLPHYTVTYDQEPLPEPPQISRPAFTLPKPAMTKAAWLLAISASASVALLFWMLIRWWQIARLARRAATSERLTALADEARRSIGMKNRVPVRLTAKTMSPAVCGLFRPTILIPQSLAAEFADEQLRAVLLHELIHLRRCDVWLNFFQTLLQIGYWWHPLVWLANARIRRVREEAVDDAVMLALRDDAETYAPTLLEVAKLALNRPLATLGLVGILESRSALRQRIERLVDFRAPRKAGLTLVSLLGILAFTAVAVPMGKGPSPTEKQVLPAPPVSVPAAAWQATNAYPTNTTGSHVTGVLSEDDPNFRQVVHALEQRSGVKTLTEPEVTTTSGRGINRITMTNLTVPVAQDSLQLFSRTYKLDPQAFATALWNTPDLPTNNVSAMARSLFSQLGVDWESPKGKAVFYNDRAGKLFVKATVSDLDTVERVIETINYTPPQIHIKARFVEVPKEFLGQTGMLSSLTNSPNGGFTGILSSTNTRVMLRALESRKDVEFLAEPEVTTTSGRQTQMKATQVLTVVTNYALLESQTNGTSSVFPQMSQLEIGPILDVIPHVLSDGYTINLAVIPSVTEFLGYDQPPDVPNVTGTNNWVQLPMVLPRFSVRQVVTTLNLWDGQTAIISGIPEATYVNGSATTGKPKARDKELLIFITATIVAPVGNRVHTDDKLPFAQTGVPPQPPQPK